MNSNTPVESRLNLADLRREYTKSGLRRADLHPDPLVQFQRWFEQAVTAELIEPSAMTLATVDASGQPSARTMLLKGVDERGFIFFTNYESRKGRDLAANNHAAIVLFWAELERQVCVKGTVTKATRTESEAYFRIRPRGSQFGAWASTQSSVVPDRAFLESRIAEVESQYQQRDVDVPPYWGGYVLAPQEIEFWQGGANRLHDRFRYQRDNSGAWRIDRLSP